MKKNQKKTTAFIALGFLALIGTYNAVMINADSLLSAQDAKNFKRLDEALGVVVEGRTPAVNNWSKVGETVHFATKPVVAAKAITTNNKVEASDAVVSEAAIQESLDLKLVEVVNPNKWQDLREKNFNGSITTKDGIIESLNASLPDGKSVEISFSEMTGNTFEYDLDGEIYSAMMYQVDENSFMVTMTNGPLEGTRMRFSSNVNPQEQVEQAQNYLAENHNVEVGTFGQEIEAPVAAEATEATEVSQAEAASFNFNQI
jgi:hypothetical protein